MNICPRQLALPTLTLATLVAALPAQGAPPFSGLLPQATFPSDHAPDLVAKALTPGAYSTYSFPFSYGKARQMALYESHDIKVPNGKKITHVGFQREGNIKSKGYSVLLRISMGASTKDAKTAVAEFDKNYDGARVNVFGGAAGKVLALPDLGDSLNPNADRPFVWVPLDQPYTYDASRNLIIDYEVLANSNGSQPFTYYLDRATFDSPVREVGPGCRHSSAIPTLRSRPTAIGSNWNVDLRSAPGSSPANMLFSFGEATVPLTFLRSDCKIYLDLTAPNFVPFMFPAMTSTSGSFTWSFAVPDVPALNDIELISQAVVLDPFAASGMALTNGDGMQVGMYPQMSAIYAQGDPNTLTRGSIYRHEGTITHFRFN